MVPFKPGNTEQNILEVSNKSMLNLKENHVVLITFIYVVITSYNE